MNNEQKTQSLPSASLVQNGLLSAAFPVRVQRKRTKGWKMPENTVYVGRPGKFGNPFTIGCNASEFSTNLPSCVSTVEEAVECYHYWINKTIMVRNDFLKPLKGKNLACFCPLDKPCHADILLRLANK